LVQARLFDFANHITLTDAILVKSINGKEECAGLVDEIGVRELFYQFHEHISALPITFAGIPAV
jgi:hypothetical protein